MPEWTFTALKLVHIGALVFWIGPTLGAWWMLRVANYRFGEPGMVSQHLYQAFLHVLWVEHGAFAVLLLSVTGAWAQDSIIDNVMKACETEINTYCSQVTPGEGRLLACFYAHEDKISGRCQYALYEGAAQLEQFAAAVTHVATECHDDLMNFCAQVELGEGRVGTCLLEHKAEVTDACRQAIDDVGLEVAED